jgi:Mg-chelatase subunit ChlD
MLAAAQRSRERGTVLFAIGLGADAAQTALREVATSPDHYYFAPGPDLLGEIYQRIADMIRTFSVTNVTVYDALASGVAFVPGSGRPDDPATDGRLAWRRGFLLPEPTTLEYDVRIQRLGDVQPSAEVWVEFTDGDGVLRRAAIEPVRLTVVEPEVHTAFLPLVTRRACHPVRDNVDVVLAVDVSSSMAGEKLEQAVDAAKAFVGLLDTPAVQAAVVRYDEAASLAQPLTGDKAALLRALDGLSTGQGTRLDRGIEAAVTELVGPRHRLDAGSAIVLLSDGRQVEEVDRARAWAEVAWSRQVAVFTIALGQDADRELLRDLADVPGHAYSAPDLAGLRAIYAQLAGAIRCR